jgi:hypothetical protein
VASGSFYRLGSGSGGLPREGPAWFRSLRSGALAARRAPELHASQQPPSHAGLRRIPGRRFRGLSPKQPSNLWLTGTRFKQTRSQFASLRMFRVHLYQAPARGLQLRTNYCRTAKSTNPCKDANLTTFSSLSSSPAGLGLGCSRLKGAEEAREEVRVKERPLHALVAAKPPPRLGRLPYTPHTIVLRYRSCNTRI